jgi:hypothetical protein
MKSPCAVNLHNAVRVSQERRGNVWADQLTARLNAPFKLRRTLGFRSLPPRLRPTEKGHLFFPTHKLSPRSASAKACSERRQICS